MPNLLVPPPSDRSATSLVPDVDALAGLSDDECVSRLAEAVESGNSARLEEIAVLLGRLAVTIE